MTQTLHYAVVDIPYVSHVTPEEKRNLRWRLKKKPWQALAAAVTTGDVAGWLEEKYHVFETFHLFHKKQVTDLIEERYEGALENMMMGHNSPPEDILTDLSPIEELFRRAIDQKEFDWVIKGVPTQASLDGVNHRLKRPYALGNPPRPSFLDTGLFRSSVKIYITE